MSDSGHPTHTPDGREDATLVAEGSRPSADATRPQPQRGQTVGRYVILGELGRGGMGVVYAAFDPELDRKVALKVLHPFSGADGTTGRARLLREAQAMAKLSHPNVIPVHDVGTHDGDVFVAMEFVEGETLAQRSAEGPRPWRETLDLFLQAGEGLAAAHAADLVHRDFKPENVMVGTDGRVRVMDFGLARATVYHTDPEQIGETTETEEGSTTSGLALGTPVTVTGAVMGTPAYMSPEQHLGKTTDARADQFSFCVATYEALYGQRPFRGDTLAAIAFCVLQGQLVEPPRDSKVPGWIWKALKHGLQTRPEDRHASMNALLEQLRRDPAVRRKQTIVTTAVLLGAVGIGWIVSSSSDAEVCQGATAQMEEVWNADTRETIRQAFDATELSFAAPSFERTSAAIDAYAAAWTSTHRDACEATRVRAEQSVAMLDRRMACLDRRRAELRGLVSTLVEADREVVAGADTAANKLSRIADCSDLETLTRGVDLPTDPQTRERVAALQLRLAEAKGLDDAGKFEAASKIATEVLEANEQLGYAPVEAEANLRRGRAVDQTGDSHEASTSMERAFLSAIEGGDEHLAAEAVTLLAYIDGIRRADFDAGERWLKIAKAWSARLGDPDLEIQVLGFDAQILRERGRFDESLAATDKALELAARSPEQFRRPTEQLHMNRGDTLRRLGKYDEAKQAQRRAVELTRDRVGEDHPSFATALNHLAIVLMEHEEYDEALEIFERVVVLRERAIGRENKDVAGTLNNIGSVHFDRGQMKEALHFYEEALDIMERTAGHDQPFTANMLNNIGNVKKALGQDQEAMAALVEALAIEKRLYGADNPKLAIPEMNLGNTYYELGQYELALEHLNRAVALAEKHLGEEHPHTGVMWSSLAMVLIETGELDQAIELHRRAREVIAAELGGDHQLLGYTLQGLGEALVKSGRQAEAIEPFEAALVIRTGKGSRPFEGGRTRFELAQALVATGGDRKRAVELASAARELFVESESETALAAADEWLARNRR